MFTTCLHCHAALGANEVIEQFTVGRRLAFDSTKGRLWVVCTKCRRWNLTPLEERWEAIEECEREFSRTRLRASTDNVALARVTEGLELVRVGTPKFPELAAWRYGRSLRQRWKSRGIPYAAAGMTGFVLQPLVNAGIIGFAASFGAIAAVGVALIMVTDRLSRVRVMLPDGRVVTLKHRDDNVAELEPNPEHGWALRVAVGHERVHAVGTSATHGLRGILTASNFFGARSTQVNDAIRRIDDAGDSRRFIERVAQVGERHGAGNVNNLPPEIRFALEMALHEDVERRAMQGELAELESEWRLAEEVAHIADNLTIGADVLTALDRLKTRESS